MVNTLAQYRSPVRLVQHAGESVEPFSTQTISRARKKLMAEIALSGDEILIDDIAYSRNDASTLLDAISESDWKMHNIIYQQKGLLRFLEKEELDADELRKADAWLYNEKFVHAVSPYFANSFNTVSGKLVKQENYDELLKLSDYSGYILPEHISEAYQKVRVYLDDLSYTLRNLSWEKFIADESILHFVFSSSWQQWFNKLPSAFSSLRDDVVEHLINIVLRFQHKATWHYLHQVLVQLKQLETNDFNRSEVVRIDEIIYKNSRTEFNKGAVKGRGGDVPAGRIIWWGIWIILMIVRIATCNDRSSKSSYFDTYTKDANQLQVKSLQEKRNEVLLLNFLDSISKKKALPLTNSQKDISTGYQPFGSFAYAPLQTGGYSVRITNTTSHNCVLVYFPEGAPAGDVYEDALSKTCATYIRSSDTYSFRFTPNTCGLHFIFGDEWGELKQQEELPIYGARSSADSSQLLFLYEFFSNKKLLDQTYLRQPIWLSNIKSDTIRANSKLLNIPNDNKQGETEIIFKEAEGKIAVIVKGNLTATQKIKKQNNPS